VTVTVPEEYNYWLDATLLRDGVLVDTVSEPANLDPQQTLEKDERQTDVGFQAEEFSGTERDRDDDQYTETPTGGSGPGFGAFSRSGRARRRGTTRGTEDPMTENIDGDVSNDATDQEDSMYDQPRGRDDKTIVDHPQWALFVILLWSCSWPPSASTSPRRRPSTSS